MVGLAERFLTVADVVHLTGFSERTVRAMVSDGRLPAIRPMGVRAVRVPEGAVRALLRPRQVAAQDAGADLR